jgi:hypothetical protein
MMNVQICNLVLTKNGGLKAMAATESFYNNRKDVLQHILNQTTFLNSNASIPCRLFHIIKNVDSVPTCKVCGNKVEFLKFNRGYRETCSSSCLNKLRKLESESKKQGWNGRRELMSTLYHIDQEFKPCEIDQVKVFVQLKMNSKHIVFTNKELIDSTDLIKSIVYYTQDIPVYTDRNTHWQQRFYHILNDITKIPTCSICGKNLNFNGKRTYHDCSCKRSTKISDKKVVRTFVKIVDKMSMLGVKQKLITYIPNRATIECCICKTVFTRTLLGAYPVHAQMRCPKCNPTYTKSKMEYTIVEHLQTDGFSVIHGYKLKNTASTQSRSYKEIDIYLPEFNIGIEVNGERWHSENFGGKNKNHHLDVLQYCKDHGVRLLQFWHSECTNKLDIVLSIIKAKCGKFARKIHGRKCKIVELDSKEANGFLKANHLQGECKASRYIGLAYNDEIVSVMAIGRRKITGSSQLEVIRFASSLNTQVHGALTKLLSYVKSDIREPLTSYADNRYADGNGYLSCGFEKIRDTDPSYYYVKGEDVFHRFTFRKNVLSDKLIEFDENLTEWQNMQNNGFDRIWDCGQSVMVYNVNT